jgi:hypothetical protein
MLLFTTASHAARPSNPPRKITKCERVLVTDTVQEKVHDKAIIIAELIGEIKLKSADAQTPAFAQHAETLSELNALIEEIRANFTKSAITVEQLIAVLEHRMNMQLPPIRAALHGGTPDPQMPGQQPRRFMKREIFGSDPMLEDWSAPEIEHYLRTPHTPAASQNKTPPPAPIVAWPEGHNPHWPPREKP